MQRQEHRQRHQQAVLGPPRGGLGAQQEVLEGPALEPGQPRVDPGGVGLQDGALAPGRVLHGAGRHLSEQMLACLPVPVESRRAEQLGQLPGRLAPQEVHLEEPVLGMSEAGDTRGILPRGGLDGGDAQPVARQRGGGGEPLQGDLTLQAREAGPEQVPQPESRRPRCQQGQRQQDGGGFQQTADEEAHGRP
ncbi:MAG TPA: hypothetical protein VJV23_05470 [Candidatus Polarisedimenticolia bacterium]|nr:hypothetical protein [Candidatus Polarisedimenticolia bacterium]